MIVAVLFTFHIFHNPQRRSWNREVSQAPSRLHEWVCVRVCQFLNFHLESFEKMCVKTNGSTNQTVTNTRIFLESNEKRWFVLQEHLAGNMMRVIDLKKTSFAGSAICDGSFEQIYLHAILFHTGCNICFPNWVANERWFFSSGWLNFFVFDFFSWSLRVFCTKPSERRHLSE